MPRLTRIYRIQWWCSLFSVLEWKYPFWTNLVHKFKIVSLSSNLVSRLIRICRIQWWCSLFLFSSGNTLFYCQFKLKWVILVDKAIFVGLISWFMTFSAIALAGHKWKSQAMNIYNALQNRLVVIISSVAV